MAEVNTFSSAVDIALQRSARLERRDDCISSVRKAIRDCQTINFFEKDLEEDSLVATGEPFIWRIPRDFRQMLAVKYPSVFSPRGEPIYPKEKLPSQPQRELDYYWYQSGNRIVFAGAGGAGASVHVAYYRYLPVLKYYQESSLRPAVYDDETQEWSYNSSAVITPTQQAEINFGITTREEILQERVTNWLLEQFFDVICDGAVQYILNLVRDPDARTVFAMYREGKIQIQKAEGRSSV